MTKRDMVVRIAEKRNISQEDAANVINDAFDYITEELAAGRTIEFRKFGIFEVKTFKARKGRNPHKPETEVIIPERTVVKFRSGKILKEKVEKL